MASGASLWVGLTKGLVWFQEAQKQPGEDVRHSDNQDGLHDCGSKEWAALVNAVDQRVSLIEKAV